MKLIVRYTNAASNGSCDEGQLSFAVIDTGIGIPAEKLSTLFDRFVQVDNTSTRSFGGTGLGLAICRRLADALDGNIAVSSDFGRGSQFTLTIRGERPGKLVEPNLTVDTAAAVPLEKIRLSATTLVVDDRRDIRYLAQHFIERAGGQVVTATNGQETAELRRRRCHLTIIALTANAMKSDRDECLAAGCTDYQTKPLNSTELISMIDRLVRASAK